MGLDLGKCLAKIDTEGPEGKFYTNIVLVILYTSLFIKVVFQFIQRMLDQVTNLFWSCLLIRTFWSIIHIIIILIL